MNDHALIHLCNVEAFIQPLRPHLELHCSNDSSRSCGLHERAAAALLPHLSDLQYTSMHTYELYRTIRVRNEPSFHPVAFVCEFLGFMVLDTNLLLLTYLDDNT